MVDDVDRWQGKLAWHSQSPVREETLSQKVRYLASPAPHEAMKMMDECLQESPAPPEAARHECLAKKVKNEKA